LTINKSNTTEKGETTKKEKKIDLLCESQKSIKLGREGQSAAQSKLMASGKVSLEKGPLEDDWRKGGKKVIRLKKKKSPKEENHQKKIVQETKPLYGKTIGKTGNKGK